MLNFWEGHKTRILSAIGILTAMAYAMGWITESHVAAIGILVGSGGLSTIHHAVVRETAKVAEKIEKVEAKVDEVPLVIAQAVAPVVVQAAAQVAQETVAAAVPPLVQLTNLSPERR